MDLSPGATSEGNAADPDEANSAADGLEGANVVEGQPADSVEASPLSGAQLEDAKRYNRATLVCHLVDKVVDFAFLAVAAVWLAEPLDAWLAGFIPTGDPSVLRAFALAAVVTVLHAVVSSPISFTAGYLIEHRYGLSNQSFMGWLRNWAINNTLAVVMNSLLFGGLFAIIGLTGGWWWLAAAAAFFVVSVVLGQLTPVLLLPLFYKVDRIDDPNLLERMTRLAADGGLTIEGVYRLGMGAETKKANAMLAGLGRTRRVLMGDTLLEAFSPEEVDVVFAHEVGHHVRRHIPKLLVAGAVIAIVGFGATHLAITRWTGLTDPVAWPTATLAPMMLLLAMMGTLIGPLMNFMSRKHEREADRYALEATGDPESFRTAFLRLARMNKADPNPHPLEVVLLHSHPPIAERLAAAKSFAASPTK
ncbi:M48 family peptidase [Pseudobythopirellula maris]|uniref:M48 family peptidase n=1 Tax=Pseudobythopirellula maris TaxID=2527991 RepID=A0A5C5ZVN8_9BACT|nr:M48 family metallopeptidase [Pseudobythopirellula maris]TWT91118.1 M48 family peptidase [Pseudobythopirellula maris]